MIPLLIVYSLLLPSNALEVIERYNWGANPTSASGPPLTGITDIVIGNDGSADCSTVESCKVWLQSLQQRDMEVGGYPDLQFNFYVSSGGDVFEGRGWDIQGSISETYSSSSLGIAYLADFSSGITAGAETTIKDLLKMGYQTGKIRSQFCMLFTCDAGLKEGILQRPACPGGSTYSDLASWQILEAVTPHYVYRPCGCGELAAPSNGQVSYSTYDVGSVATYSCSEGFQLIGESKRTCEISGSWNDLSVNFPQCTDPSRGLILVPKNVWDVVVEEKQYIDGGFPIATFFVDVADAYCVDDTDCRAKLKELKKSAWDDHQEKDVLCNFYIAKTGIVYEGRGWGIKGAYSDFIQKTQGICFLGLDAVSETAAMNTLFRLAQDAKDTKKLYYDMGSGYCFQSKCPDMAEEFCKAVTNWMVRSDSPDFSNKYCLPDPIPADNRASAAQCRHKKTHGTWLNYEGTRSVSVSGCECLKWGDQTTTQHHFYPEVYEYAALQSNYCRNPDMSDEGPWCITDSSCGGKESCAIPQCAPAVSFTQYSALRYKLSKTKSTTTDKLTMTIKPNTLNARLLRIEGDQLNGDPAMLNYWDISLDQGIVKIEMVLTHGNEVTSLKVEGSKALSSGETSQIQVLRKNHKVLLLINGQESKYTHDANLTDFHQIDFFNPGMYVLGTYISGGGAVFQGCISDVTFNKDDLLAVATGGAPERGEMIKEDIKDDGCVATLPFEWGDIDIVTTPPPTTTEPTIIPITEAQSDSTKDNLAYIIIGVVILVILIVLLIGCLIFRRHNRDKGVYKVDEATTTKWDWKRGIVPVLTERGGFESLPNKQDDEGAEVFA